MHSSVLSSALSVFVRPELTGDERERRIYLTLCLLVGLGILGGFLGINSVAGRSAEAVADVMLMVILATALALNRTASDPLWALRLATAGALALFVWAIHGGLGEGVSYLWFYCVPGPAFFLFGPREGSAWVGASFLFSATILYGPVGFEYSGDLALRFTVTYGFVTLLALILERSRSRLHAELAAEKGELEVALGEVRTLSEMIPMCAWCRKVRDDAGFWSQIEDYLDSHTGTQISHGLCPECAGKMKVE